MANETIARLQELSRQILAAETASAYLDVGSPEQAALDQVCAAKYEEFETLADAVWAGNGKSSEYILACAVIAKHYADHDQEEKLKGLNCEAPFCDRSVAELITAVLNGQLQTAA